jgi:hypothetical protein
VRFNSVDVTTFRARAAKHKMKKAIAAVLATGTLSYAALVCVFGGLISDVNHDEHQFMASAYMVARHGLQPYRDFAYLHMPNLVYVYVPFFVSQNPFLAARLFNALCGFGLCLTVFLISRSLFRPLGPLLAAAASAAGTILLPNTFIFQYASSKVWNQASATLCAVLAFLLHSKAIREARFAYFVLSGFALGMALGIRLTVAPLIVPFVLAILAFGSASWQKKARSAVAFAIGGMVANLPAIYFCCTSYRDFIFGNFGYRILNLRYVADEIPYPTEATLVGRVQYLIDSFSPDSGNFLVPIVAALGIVMLSIAVIQRFSKPRAEVLFLIGLLPFLLVGCLAPTPAHYQYYFVLIPFLLLLALYALSSLGSPKLLRTGTALLVIAGVISFFSAALVRENIADIGSVFHPKEWVPLQVKEESEWIKQQLVTKTPGKVLTLSPLYVIEAGLPIYKEFVTGPFAWRVSAFATADEAAARKLPYAPGLNELLRKEPPLAVLAGEDTLEQKQEEMIIGEIALLWYRPAITPHGAVLWQAQNEKQ